ncbi:MAG TPA: serine hydrolase [Chthoniobacterales bacterium]|jgi:CubicO group peptidase (beta-lactamase class C family)|nr:serine hydrolase [Chthoniobacterales bacterium]
MKSTRLLLAVFLVVVQLHAKEPPPAQALAGIDEVVDRELKTFQVPGVSVAVVVGDAVVLAKGYGLRDLEKKLPMSAETQMPIASITKQFTVAALATLVRQGKLDWDKPVREYLPDFRMHNEYATSHLTPRDLVTHRTGLPRHDAIWYGSDLNREQIYHRLPFFEFSRDLRVRFQYNNLMFMTAGYLGGQIAKSSWEELVKGALFDPLGMKRSNFSVATMKADANCSQAYELNTKREVVRIEYSALDAAGPAGAINSSVDEMAHYARMMLAGGMFEGKRVLLESDVQAMMQPQVPIGKDLFSDVFGFRNYGMGLFVQTYRGIEIAHHGGNLDGLSASLVLVPSKKIAVIVLANRTGTRLRDALPFEIIDRLLGLESSGLLARHRQLEEKGFAGEDAAKAAGTTDRKPNTKPARPLADYAAEYLHPGYGPMKVAVEKDRLKLSYNKFSTPLDHWHYEVFQAPADRQNPLELTKVQFNSDLSGDVASISVPLEPNVEPIVFSRQAPAEMRDRKFLEPIAGEYDGGGVPVTIAVREDNVLQYMILGNVRELEPVRGTYFRMKGLTGVAVEFLKNPAGQYDRMVYYSPGGEPTISPRTK